MGLARQNCVDVNSEPALLLVLQGDESEETTAKEPVSKFLLWDFGGMDREHFLT